MNQDVTDAYFQSPAFTGGCIEGGLTASSTKGVRVQYEGLSYWVRREASRKTVMTVGDQWWQLLTGCFRPSKRTKFCVLKDLNGVLLPQRLTLVLGPPGNILYLYMTGFR